MTVNPSVPAASVKELIALAKARRGELNYGSSGPGTTPHLATETLKTMTRVDLVHASYKGGIFPALTDTIAGQVQLTIPVIPAALPFIKAGKLKALGVTSRQRTPLGSRSADDRLNGSRLRSDRVVRIDCARGNAEPDHLQA